MAKSSLGVSAFTSQSNLGSGADRFLSQVVAHALENDFRTAEDFLRLFPPIDLMNSLEGSPELRGEILTKAVGFHERVARKKSPESAAEDLRIALEEGVTTASDILDLVGADDRVRYLDRARLFGFAVERDYFAKSNYDKDRAVERMVFLLDTALGEGLIALSDLIDALSYETISQSLGTEELRKIVESALRLGRSGDALTEERLLEVVPLAELIKALPLDQIWTRVIVAKVAEPARFVAAPEKVEKPAPANKPIAAAPAPDRAATAPTKNGTSEAAKQPAKPVREPPPKPSKAPAPPANGRPKAEAVEAASGPDTAGEEDTARRRVTERLAGIQRLPPRHAEISTQILFEIDSMYAELLSAGSEEAREEAVRDAFPNEQHLTTALLALIELLEPTIDVNDPEIAKADSDSLINVFLIEERGQREQASSSQRPATAPPISGMAPPPPPPVRRSVPPPLPRGGSPMPPPLPGHFEKAR